MTIFKLAWRNLWRNRRRTLITVISIAFGTTLGIFFISMGDGMYKKLIDDAVSMNAGHVTVEHREYAAAPSIDLLVPSVTAVEQTAAAINGVSKIKPLIVSQAVVSTGSGSAGIGITGVDPAIEADTSPLAKHIISGTYLQPDNENGVIIGSILAERLRLKPGKKLVITTNNIHGELVGELLRVSGIFETGVEEADGFLIQVPITAARKIFAMGPDQATQVGLILENPDYQEAVITELGTRLKNPDLAALPWQEVMPDLAGFMAVDMGSGYVFQAIILFLIGFTILNTILMSVLERTREFATLLALGTSPAKLKLQILLESALLGLVGTGLGLLIGGAISYYFQLNGLDFTKLFGAEMTITGFAVDPIVRNYLTFRLMAWLGGIVMLMTMLIGIYPAFKTGNISLPDVLRSK